MLTWREACDTFIETTELGYTLKSLDKCWVVATVEDGEWHDVGPEWIGNPVYHTVRDKVSSYDLWDDVAIFRSRREAEAYIKAMPEPSYRDLWFTLNLGDETRWEHAFLRGEVGYTGRLFRPKYLGSRDWFDHRRKIWRKKAGLQ